MKNSGKRNREKSKNYFAELVKEQADRIAELKKQNADLTLALDALRSKESEITATLATIKKREEESRAEVKIKYALECERLKNFRAKWIEAARLGSLKSDFEKTEKLLKDCQAELEQGFSDDLGASDYLMERDRLNDDPILNYEAIIASESEKINLTKSCGLVGEPKSAPSDEPVQPVSTAQTDKSPTRPPFPTPNKSKRLVGDPESTTQNRNFCGEAHKKAPSAHSDRKLTELTETELEELLQQL